MDPLQNPIAEQLDALTRPLAERIDAVADLVTLRPMLEHEGFRSFVLADDGEECDADGWRMATNLEAATFVYDWIPTKGEFDMREPLPHQLADWLRTNAGLMLRAACAIEALTDDRDLMLIRDIVDGGPVLHPELEDA